MSLFVCILLITPPLAQLPWRIIPCQLAQLSWRRGGSILSDRLRQVTDARLRELFVCLLSGALEFNNMFASYKEEGTGAVRHMFAHHILKPERMPLEANIWGTPKSSGSFSTLFNARIRPALDYAENPLSEALTLYET